jgi:acetoin utilization protein AcuC
MLDTSMDKQNNCCVYLGDGLASYGFGNDHPFGPMRHHVFKQAFFEKGLDQKTDILPPVIAGQDTIELFHTHEYVEKVKQQSKLGVGYLDQGDTPSFIGMFEAASYVAGSVCNAIDELMSGHHKRAFIPIAGLHHARRHVAAGFCVFNDCGIAIEYLRHKHNIKRVAYVDIDAHHGDGVFYSFDDDPDLIFADLHEDGKYLYPGTGTITETGSGGAKGTKLNIPMPPGANDVLFKKVWPKVEEYLRVSRPDFILLQCGADSIDGDPITHMAYSESSHAYATQQLCQLADECCDGKLLVMGGGGYNHDNIAKTWTAVVNALIQGS